LVYKVMYMTRWESERIWPSWGSSEATRDILHLVMRTVEVRVTICSGEQR